MSPVKKGRLFSNRRSLTQVVALSGSFDHYQLCARLYLTFQTTFYQRTHDRSPVKKGRLLSNRRPVTRAVVPQGRPDHYQLCVRLYLTFQAAFFHRTLVIPT